jgi:hypothetical protein
MLKIALDEQFVVAATIIMDDARNRRNTLLLIPDVLNFRSRVEHILTSLPFLGMILLKSGLCDLISIE